MHMKNKFFARNSKGERCPIPHSAISIVLHRSQVGSQPFRPGYLINEQRRRERGRERERNEERLALTAILNQLLPLLQPNGPSANLTSSARARGLASSYEKNKKKKPHRRASPASVKSSVYLAWRRQHNIQDPDFALQTISPPSLEARKRKEKESTHESERRKFLFQGAAAINQASHPTHPHTSTASQQQYTQTVYSAHHTYGKRRPPFPHPNT